jgi:membrane-anchored protein YejM (alkaline phosphatase superfamily)
MSGKMTSGADSQRRRLARWWSWLVAATIFAGAVISLRYVAAAGPAGAAIVWWMRALTVGGQVATLATVLLLPVLALALLLPRPRIILSLGIAVSSLFLIFLLTDSEVYRLYRFHVNPGVFELLTGGAGSQIFVFPWIMYAQMLGIAAATIAWQSGVAIWIWGRIGAARQRSLQGRLAVLCCGSLIVGYQVTHAWADAVGFTPVTRDASLLPFAYPFKARGLMRKLGFEVRHDRWQIGPSSGGVNYPLVPLQCAPPAAARNIVFLVIDSWRFDALDPAVTPHISRFAARAARFEQHFSGGNATRAGIFSLFYGIPATYWHDMLQQRRGPVLVSELLDHGYQLGVFQSAPLGSPEFNETVFARVQHPRMESTGDSPAARDRDLTNDFEAFLTARDPSRPFFAFLFFDSPHAYDFPADFPLAFQPSLGDVNYLSLGPESDPAPFHNRYLNSVRYADTLAGEVLDKLQEDGLLDSAVVLVTGDHGQEFNDNGLGFWGHNSNFTRFQTEVPLLLSAPDVPAGAYSHRTSHFDVAPTIMSRYLGCSTPMDQYSVGHDLFEPGGRDMLVLGSYQDFAVLEPQRIISVRKTGVDVLDASGRPAATQGLDSAAVASAIEQNSRFRLGGGAGG